MRNGCKPSTANESPRPAFPLERGKGKGREKIRSVCRAWREQGVQRPGGRKCKLGERAEPWGSRSRKAHVWGVSVHVYWEKQLEDGLCLVNF